MLIVQSASVRFGSHTALDGFTGSFAPGQISALAGGDGAGKSTLLRALAGRVGLRQGRITVEGAGNGTRSTEVTASGQPTPLPGSLGTALPAPREIGWQPASGGVWGNLSVDENLEFVTRVYGLDPRSARDRREELLARAGLDRARGRIASRLSGGMRRKLGFVLATLHQPSLVLLDEPTTGVDPHSREELWTMIADAAEEGATVVLATTYLDEAARAHQVFLLGGGRLLSSGPPERIAADIPGVLWEAPCSGEAGLADPASRRDGAVEAGRSASGATGWRRARTRYAWSPEADTAAPPGFGPSQPDLENASIVLLLAEERRLAGTGGDAGADGRGDAASAESAMRISAHPLVRTRDVVKRYGGVAALDGVSLELGAGEIVGLLGGNGAGKTTLIRQILGVEQPSAGSCETFGEKPSTETRRRIGYVAQGLGLYPSLSAAENIDFVASVHRCRPTAEALEQARAWGTRAVRDLPLGAQRTLAYLTATVHAPELLILDEPTSGMDPLARARLWERIHAHAAAGAGVLVTTHYMQEAAQCDRRITLENGRVSAEEGA